MKCNIVVLLIAWLLFLNILEERDPDRQLYMAGVVYSALFTRSTSLILRKGSLLSSSMIPAINSGVSFSWDKGLHTLQGLYPCSSASCVELKNSTFSGFGFLAVQTGLQKIPVVFTAVIKVPSYSGSLRMMAWY
jgi:hypothetical protein